MDELIEALHRLCAIEGRPFTVAERAESKIAMSQAAAALEAAREDAERWRERYVAQLACYRQDLHGDMANDAIDRAEKAAERIAMLDQARGKEVLREAE